MSFATKWNLRDVFRHKTRTVMMLVGIIGRILQLMLFSLAERLDV
jgi:hypothetical protein